MQLQILQQNLFLYKIVCRIVNFPEIFIFELFLIENFQNYGMYSVCYGHVCAYHNATCTIICVRFIYTYYVKQ